MVAVSRREAINKVLRRVHNIKPKNVPREVKSSVDPRREQLEDEETKDTTRTSLYIGVARPDLTTGFMTDPVERRAVQSTQSAALRRAEIARRRGMQAVIVDVPYKMSRTRVRTRDTLEQPPSSLDPVLQDVGRRRGFQIPGQPPPPSDPQALVAALRRSGFVTSADPKPKPEKQTTTFTNQGVQTEWNLPVPAPQPVPRPTPMPVPIPEQPRPDPFPQPAAPPVQPTQVQRGETSPGPPEPPLDTRFNKLPSGQNKLDAYLGKITNPFFIKQNLQYLLSANVQNFSPKASMQPLRTIRDDSRATIRAIY